MLPGTVTVVVPAVLLARNGVDVEPLLVVLGAPLIVAGFLMWVWTVRLFARIGKGTLAPWDPTTQLVVEGPYAHVRNPMITGVLAVLLGEALVFGSVPVAIWAAVFAVTITSSSSPTRSRRSSGGSVTSTAVQGQRPALGPPENRVAA